MSAVLQIHNADGLSRAGFDRYCSRLVLMCVLAAVFFGASGVVNALTYSNQINESAWKARTSVLSCELTHEVPLFGKAVFRTRAGEASGFYLRGKTARFKAGEVDIVAASPVWINEPKKHVIATVGMKQGTTPLWLGTTITEQMLDGLNQGMAIKLHGEKWFSQPPPYAELQMSTIGFREQYEKYLACLPGLIPRNFDQLRRTSLLFPGGEIDILPKSLAAQLDRILTLVKHDDKVRRFYIDGHADSVGARDENLGLSKVRAELVAQYLQRRGVPEDWMTVRWHGERYPVVSNATASGRAKNRRVTVRLEREEEIEVLPLASN